MIGAGLRRWCRHLLGRHDLAATVAGSVDGYWLWCSACSCGLRWRGAEATREAADARAAGVAGPRDTVTRHEVHGSRAGVELWPEVPVLRIPAPRLYLPRSVREAPFVVACDGSRRDRDEHAGWAAITGAGWYLTGTRDYHALSIDALELVAISHALRLYPARSTVRVLSDNEPARSVTRAILRGRLRAHDDAPSWVPLDAFRALRRHKFRQLTVHITTVRSKTHPLHNVADSLARGLSPAPVLAAGGVHCG